MQISARWAAAIFALAGILASEPAPSQTPDERVQSPQGPAAYPSTPRAIRSESAKRAPKKREPSQDDGKVSVHSKSNSLSKAKSSRPLDVRSDGPTSQGTSDTAPLPPRENRSQPSGSETRTPPRSQPVQTADEQFGTCLACHGREGQSETPEIPSLSAQPSLFVTNQLLMFREGKRKIPAMDLFANQFSDENLLRYADIISKLPKPMPPAEASDPARFERGKTIAAAAHCDTCHSQDYSGNGPTPRLAHQREDYLIKALRDYKSAARVDGGPTTSMSSHTVSNAEATDLAHYLAHFR